MKRSDVESIVLRWFVTIGATLGWLSALVLCVAIFAGCATTQAPSVVSHIEPPPPVVRVPILIGCVEPEQIPQPPGTPELDTTLTAWQLAVTVRKKLLEWSAYAARADSLLRGCAKPEAKP